MYSHKFTHGVTTVHETQPGKLWTVFYKGARVAEVFAFWEDSGTCYLITHFVKSIHRVTDCGKCAPSLWFGSLQGALDAAAHGAEAQRYAECTGCDCSHPPAAECARCDCTHSGGNCHCDFPLSAGSDHSYEPLE